MFLTGLAAFLVVALATTLLALWFLRGNHNVWQAMAVASLHSQAPGWSRCSCRW